jgi:prophage regulatory protein
MSNVANLRPIDKAATHEHRRDVGVAVRSPSDVGTAFMPELGFVRLPAILTMFPVGKSTWWNGVKSGRFPRPVKLGPRVTAWRVEDIRALLREFGDRVGSELEAL